MQFGLHNVFTHATDRRETTHAFKDYTDREIEISSALKARDEKAYKRLVKALPLITKMQKFHHKCSYSALIHYYCSSHSKDASDVGAEISLETERSRELTQREISTISTRMSDEETPVTSKDGDIIRHHTPHNQVC